MSTNKLESTPAAMLRKLAKTLQDNIDNLDEIQWRSTPALKDVIETDGLGNFRWTKSMDKVRMPKDRGHALVLKYKDENKTYKSISLQKFVALIYRPRLNDEPFTKVIDGDRTNLSATNVEWCSPKGGRIY